MYVWVWHMGFVLLGGGRKVPQLYSVVFGRGQQSQVWAVHPRQGSDSIEMTAV